MKKTAIVQLGRYGDIINILPVAKLVSKMDGERPAFIVSKNYADILDGVCYVDPVVINCDFADINRGIQMAKLQASNVLVAQVYGWGYQFQTEMDAFNVESWYRTGFIGKWGTLIPEFDRREMDREQDLRNFFKIHEDGRPVLLTSFGGNSSPYRYAGALGADIKTQLEDRFNIIDLTPARCHRIYDLLGLMDVAAALVTIDTATLHLAAASPKLPVVALITDKPSMWHGARPPSNTVLKLRYKESEFNFQHIIDTIERNRFARK